MYFLLAYLTRFPLIVTILFMIGVSFLVPSFFAQHPFWFVGSVTCLYIGIKTFFPESVYTKSERPFTDIPPNQENTEKDAAKEKAPSSSKIQAPEVSHLDHSVYDFSDLLKMIHEETKSHLKATSPSAISLFVRSPEKKTRYPIPLELILHFDKLNSLKFCKSPVVSLPQKKKHFFFLNIKILLNEMKQNADVQTLEIKGSDFDQSCIHLFLLTSLLISAQSQPFSCPFILALPETILTHPHIRQIFIELLEHPQFPHHQFLFVISRDLAKNMPDIFSNFARNGLSIGLIVEDFNTATIPNFVQFLCISQKQIQKQLDGMARRLSSHLLQTFSEQPQKIILSDVDDTQFLQDILPTQFDYAFGGAFGQKTLDESL